MNITWQDVFSIVKKIWALKNIRMAECLKCDRSTVGRILKGERKDIQWDVLDIYKLLFDLDNENSPASKHGEKVTFKRLKEELEGFEEITKSLNHEDYKDFVMGLLLLTENNVASKNELKGNKKTPAPEVSSAQYESALKEFERVIAKYSFKEFIESEPLLRFIARSEPEANRLKLRYNKYVDRVCDNEITLQGFCHEYERYFTAGSQIENIQYTDKLLTSTLLTMSEKLVDVLVEKIFPAAKTLDRYVRKNIFEFKEALESYNELLVENLGVKNDSFVFDPDVTDYEDENSTV
ncbi:MAG: hypothetical protein FWB88_05730, partial [Defluviitaleaceae bacterium]|nr:hypothetical protein [Defluviitaleaceae bacterium]MCL2240626.1 hypothetical protein [Defluviitaleaceae bacterium]